jgi:hypothetical protein
MQNVSLSPEPLSFLNKTRYLHNKCITKLMKTCIISIIGQFDGFIELSVRIR